MSDIERLKVLHERLIQLLAEEQAILNDIIDMLRGADS